MTEFHDADLMVNVYSHGVWPNDTIRYIIVHMPTGLRGTGKTKAEALEDLSNKYRQDVQDQNLIFQVTDKSTGRYGEGSTPIEALEALEKANAKDDE